MKQSVGKCKQINLWNVCDIAVYHCAKKLVTTMLTIPLEMYSFTL